MDTCRRGHPRNAGNTYRDGSCKLCRQINRANQEAVRTGRLGTRDRPILRPQEQPETVLERAIANESWTVRMPWERPGWRPQE